VKRIARVVPWIVNGLCLVVASALLYGAIAPKAQVPAKPAIEKGQALSVAGVRWSAHRRTLVMAVRPGCGWCTASAPFYRRMGTARDPEALFLLAVTPGPVQETDTYLRSLAVKVDAIKQADFSRLGVSGTPTLILVDQQGRVESVWVGMLSPQRESELLAAVNRESVANAGRP